MRTNRGLQFAFRGQSGPSARRASGHRSGRRWLAAAVLLAALLGGLLIAAPAKAATVSRAFSDTNVAPSATDALAILQAQTSVCRKRSGKGGAVLPSESKASATALRLLAGHGSPARLKALLSGPKLAHSGDNTFGLAGLAKAQPGVSLAGFLAAHERAPADPLPLLDAAVMLSSMGRQPDALALLSAAERLPAGFAPMGISVKALIDNARGVALFRLGRFSQAAGEFRSATGLAAGLPQPKRNLAAALLCEGQAQQAVAPYIAGTYFDPVSSPPAPDVLDLSKGVLGTVPQLKWPASADDGAASYQDMAAVATAADNTEEQAFQQATQSLNQLAADQAPLLKTGAGRLTIKREDAVISFWNNWQTDQPNLGALYARVQADYTQMEADSPGAVLTAQIQSIESSCAELPTTPEAEQCRTDKCWPAVRAGHSAWLPQMMAYDNDVRALVGPLYQYATALASNVTSQSEASAITASARQFMYLAFYGETSLIETMTSAENSWQSPAECNAGGSGTGAGDDGGGSTPDAALCPPGIEAPNFAISFEVFEFAVNCDEVEFSASDGAVGPVVSGTYKFEDGSLTAFLGAKAGFDLDEEGGPNVSAKGGVYLTWDAQGNPTDVGIQINGPSLGSGDWNHVSIGTDDAADFKVSLAPELLN